MNTFAKFLAGASVAALIPLAGIANAETVANVDSTFKGTGKAVPSVESVEADKSNPKVVTDQTYDSRGDMDPAKRFSDAIVATKANGPDMIPVQERDFDTLLANAKLVESPLDGQLVVSSDNKAVGSVSSVYEQANGDLLAEVALDSTLETTAMRALLPVTTITTDGDLVMKGDYDAIKATFQAEEGVEINTNN
jgi:hypothetical protein|tara:strand:+ start:324 stop:905 length:582 start_codon:yes stop_codon:yes gene_type:complete